MLLIAWHVNLPKVAEHGSEAYNTQLRNGNIHSLHMAKQAIIHSFSAKIKTALVLFVQGKQYVCSINILFVYFSAKIKFQILHQMLACGAQDFVGI